MAGADQRAGARDRMSHMCGKASDSRGKRPCEPLPGTGERMGQREKRPAAAGTGVTVQQPSGLVAVQLGPCVPSTGVPSSDPFQRMSGVQRTAGNAGLQRPCDTPTGVGVTVAHVAECTADAGDGDDWQPAKNLVAVRGRTHLESDAVFPNGAEEMWLPGLRGLGEADTLASVCGPVGTASGDKTVRSSFFLT